MRRVGFQSVSWARDGDIERLWRSLASRVLWGVRREPKARRRGLVLSNAGWVMRVRSERVGRADGPVLFRKRLEGLFWEPDRKL